jgi:hemin uptake protein HemP|tara:strand:+ start:743 stop:1048 length:306 start_codon:yes stop_codon:yes gene_type:complete
VKQASLVDFLKKKTQQASKKLMTEQKPKVTQKKKTELTQNPVPESTQEPIAMEEKNPEIKVQNKAIHSHDLLHHGKEVFILHKGDQYLLRCTRNGKLILTK